jgi:hypothetical protein
MSKEYTELELRFVKNPSFVDPSIIKDMAHLPPTTADAGAKGRYVPGSKILFLRSKRANLCVALTQICKNRPPNVTGS